MRSPLVAPFAFGLIAVAAQLPAQTATAPTFAPPVKLMAGTKGLGENRLFPSPVLHDMDGDGLADLVVGDLRGRLTVALVVCAARWRRKTRGNRRRRRRSSGGGQQR